MTADERWMQRLSEGRKVRDERVTAAKRELSLLVANAYAAGLSLAEIHEATNLASMTIREMIKSHNVSKPPRLAL